MKPTVKKGPASRYAGPHETILEILSIANGVRIGCLLSVRRTVNTAGVESLSVEIYCADKGVRVVAPALTEMVSLPA